MKNTLTAIAAALIFAALPAAHAQEVTPQVKISSRVILAPEQFRDFVNSYKLSNGQVVKFTHEGGQLFYAKVDNGKQVRMRPVSAQEFVTDAGTSIVFRDYGDEVGINNFERLPKAQALPANTTVVARR